VAATFGRLFGPLSPLDTPRSCWPPRALVSCWRSKRHAEPLDPFPELDQLLLRVMRRCDLQPDRKPIRALPGRHDEDGIPACVVDRDERAGVIEIRHRAVVDRDRPMLRVVWKRRSGGDGADNEIV